MRLGPRVLLVTVAVAVFITMAVALYVFLEPMGSRRVFFQGRYLAPISLLLLLSAYGIPFVRRHRATPVLVGALLTVMVLNLQTLIWAYHA